MALPFFALPLIVLGCIIAGALVGIYFERTRWNALIREGKIPRPGQRAEWVQALRSEV